MNYPEDALATEPERFFVSPPMLKTIASQKMILVLYQHFIRNHRGNEVIDSDWLFNSSLKTKDLIETMPVLEQMIDNLWDPVILSLALWCDYHENFVFFDGGFPDAFLNCIDCFVLMSCGWVSYSDTAKNLLTNDKLNVVEKFRLACLNCFADDIKDIWPLVWNNPRVTVYNPNDQVLIHYWIRVLNGETPRLVGNNPDSFEDHMRALQNNESMSMVWAQIEYFWNVLSEDEQIEAAERILQQLEQSAPFLLEHVLLRLNNEQLGKVLEEIDFGATIIRSLKDGPARIFEYVYEIWSNVKYFISPHKFPKIIKLLVSKGSSDMHENYMSSFLLQMWTSAPDRFRRHFLNDLQFVEDVFRNLHESNYNRNRLISCNFGIGLFIEILAGLSFQSRNALWCKFWRNLIVSGTFKSLNRAMKLCFNNDDEITNFKERHMMDFNKIHDFCCLLISNGYVLRLDDYLKFCSSYVHYVASVKRQILASSRIQSAFLSEYSSSEMFVEMDKFIDSAFFDEDDVKKYKRQLMSKFEPVGKAYEKVDKSQQGISWV